MAKENGKRPEYGTAADDAAFKADYARRTGEKAGSIPSGKRKSVGGGLDADFVGFVNVQLSNEAKSEFDAWSVSFDVWAWLGAAALSGITISLKSDPKSDGFMASATQRDRSSVNAGRCFTMRAKNAGIALMRLAFVHTCVLPDRWADYGGDEEADRW